ncbi:MAG: ABC transporter ATP-binding protein [Saprospiraceae bacterium]|nr:ABC transporter ATP-binding protein [Saprospiraceae bacterium]
MIEISGLQKSFGKLQVLHDINLELKSSSCIALIGPNGCGKTTLIKSILGMVIPQNGDIKISGKSIIYQHKYRELIGYMPQIGRYPGNLSIGQLIKMVRDLRPARNEYDEELIDAFRLSDIIDKKMSTLSGGTTQKVSAVLAFLFDPPILILDEPTAGLDPVSSEALKVKISKEVEKGKLVVITSHILSELDDLVTSIIFMNEGRIAFNKTVSELLQDTQEEKISRAIVTILTNQQQV